MDMRAVEMKNGSIIKMEAAEESFLQSDVFTLMDTKCKVYEITLFNTKSDEDSIEIMEELSTNCGGQPIILSLANPENNIELEKWIIRQYENVGFIDVNFYVGYETKTAMLYGNASAVKCLERMKEIYVESDIDREKFKIDICNDRIQQCLSFKARHQA